MFFAIFKFSDFWVEGVVSEFSMFVLVFGQIF